MAAEWPSRRLADVLRLEYGASLPERSRVDGRVPVFGSAGHVGWHNTPLVPGPGIVVGRKGSIGEVTWVATDFFPIDTTYYVVPVDGKADLRWAYHLLAREDLSRLNRATGVPGLNRDDVYALQRRVPPLAEQRAIAAVLDAIDEAIEQTEAAISATETLRKALLHELLTRGVPGWHTEWKHVPGIGTIPANWEVVRLGNVATIERGRFGHRPRNEPRFYGGPYPFIQTGDVAAAMGRIRSWTQTLNDQGLGISKLFPAGTVVMTIAANIGETAVTEIPVAFPDSLVGIIPHSVNPEFLEYFLRTKREELQSLAPRSAQQNINLEILKPLRVPLPPRAEQDAAAALLGSAEELEANEAAVLGRLQGAKAAVADALLTGRMRTGEPEPASQKGVSL